MAQDRLDGSTGGDPGFTGPSDREIIEVLKRVASAQAQLVHAESQSAQASQNGPGELSDADCDKIEDAHKELVWAQAAIMTDKRPARAQKALRAAEAREEALLRLHGFSSFGDYRRDRNQVPTEDIHLTLARREYESARLAWADLQREIKTSVIVDLTGGEPRVID